MRKAVLALLLLAAPAWAQDPLEPSALPPPAEPLPQERESGMRLGMLAGGLVSMSSGASTASAPTIRLSVEAALARYERPPRLLVTAELAALPGEALTIQEAETFRSLEFGAGIGWKPDKDWFFSVYAMGGFATRLPANPEPIERTARFGSIGLRFSDDAGDNYLEVGSGPDQRLDGTYQWCAHLSGAVELWQAKSDKVGLVLFGRAILGLDPTFQSDIHTAPGDVVQIGIAIRR